jgi:D-glycero-alpha-D-manno-heptose-7-phosphate kinase
VVRRAVADEAREIELDLLKEPIGKQDQYMAVYGGLTSREIDRTGKVKTTPSILNAHALAEFVANIHLDYTNTQRGTTEILTEQNQGKRLYPDGF